LAFTHGNTPAGRRRFPGRVAATASSALARSPADPPGAEVPLPERAVASHTAHVLTRQRAWIIVMLAVPWIGAILYFWHHRPRDGRVPPSLADEARERLGA
jgi:hypothetical protein